MIKILQIEEPKTTALQYWRQIIPHQYLIHKYRDENIIIHRLENSIHNLTENNKLSDYNIVHFLRKINLAGNSLSDIKKCKDAGCKIVFDIDDYWEVPKTHFLYEAGKKHNISEQIKETIKYVDYVTTTTQYFADIISGLNKNVIVLPNCISPLDPQFFPKSIPNSLIRLGWIGGIHHLQDLKHIEDVFKKLYEYKRNEDIKNKYQICLGGYNYDPNYPEYFEIEKIMTKNYSYIDSDYKNFLLQQKDIMPHYTFNQPYRRLWMKDIFHYGELYNEIDIALIPLKQNKFSACKSELKIIEAGWMGKTVICSDVYPYKPFLNKKNSIPCSTTIDWYLAMKKLIKEKFLREDLAAGMNETIKKYFNIDKHTQARYELYKHLIK